MQFLTPPTHPSMSSPFNIKSIVSIKTTRLWRWLRRQKKCMSGIGTHCDNNGIYHRQYFNTTPPLIKVLRSVTYSLPVQTFSVFIFTTCTVMPPYVIHFVQVQPQTKRAAILPRFRTVWRYYCLWFPKQQQRAEREHWGGGGGKLCIIPTFKHVASSTFWCRIRRYIMSLEGVGLKEEKHVNNQLQKHWIANS